MSLGELQSTSLQDKMAATAFLNDILKQSMQTLEKAATASSEDAISFFRKALKSQSVSLRHEVTFGKPLFRTFISNNMTLPYYCFVWSPLRRYNAISKVGVWMPSHDFSLACDLTGRKWSWAAHSTRPFRNSSILRIFYKY